MLGPPLEGSSVPQVTPPNVTIRWVALSAPRVRRRSGPPPPSPTPSYPANPGWGLQEPPPPPEEPETILQWWAMRAPLVLGITAVAYLCAASGELIRYTLLMYNRAHLIPGWAATLSDALLWVSAPVAMVLGIVSLLAATCRLILERELVFESVGRSDPRSRRSLILGCVIPVVNWVYPGVFLAEIDRTRAIPPSHDFTRVFRWWWALWVLGWLLLIGEVAWQRRAGLQAVTDGVLFSALTDLVAAAVAAATVLVFRRITDESMLGGPRRLRRWTISVEGDAMIDKARAGAIAPIVAIDQQPPTSEAQASEMKTSDDVHAESTRRGTSEA